MPSKKTWLWLAAALLAAAPGYPEIRITGRVALEEGVPLPEAQVELLPIRGAFERAVDELAGRQLPEPAAGALSDTGGLFELWAPEPGAWVVRVAADGFVPMQYFLSALVEDTVLPAVTVRMDHPLTVTVRGPEAEAVAGAVVHASGRSRWLWQPARMMRRFWRPAQRRTLTDAEGRGLLSRAAGEKLELRAYAPGLAIAEPVETSSADVTLTLRAGRRLSVLVERADGRPAEGAAVLVGDEPWAAGVTDGDGLLATVLSADDRLGAVTADGALGDTRAPADADRVTLSLTDPVVVAGRVLDADSRRPIAGAIVLSGGGAGRSARSERDGRFSLRIEGGEDQARAYLRAAAAGYFAGGMQLAIGQAYEPMLALEPAAAAAGVVVDEAGEPVAGAELIAIPIPENRAAVRAAFRRQTPPALSGEDGSFRLGNLTPGMGLRIRATGAGRAPAETDLAPLEPRTVRSGLRLVLGRGVGLTGRILGAGEPVAAAELSLERETEGTSPFAQMPRELHDDTLAGASGEDGTFEYRHLMPGRYRLEIAAPGFAPRIVPGVQVDPAEGGTDLGTLELEPGVEITGVVVDGDGQPVGGADVRAMSQQSGRGFAMRFRDSEEPAAVTDTAGRFVLPDRRPGERVDIQASHAEYSPGSAPGVEAPNDRPVRIVLERAARISGTVLDPRGEPIEDAMIAVSITETGSTAVGASFSSTRTSSRATTDAAGAFELESVPPGKVRLTAMAEGWRQAELSDLEVPAGGSLEGLRLVLERGATVTGQVLAADGLPAIGVTVMVEEQRSMMSFSMPVITSADGDGHYLLEGVEPGPRTIMAYSDELGRTAKELEVTPGVNRLDLRFAGGAEVSGRVIDDGGAPIGGATVSLLATAQAWRGAEAQSAENGGFTIEGVRDGQYVLRVGKAGYATHAGDDPVRVAGGPVSGLEVVLQAGGAITGRLFGLEPGELAQVELMATHRESQWAMGHVSHDGSYRIPDLAPGEWVVRASLFGGRQASGRVTLDPGVAEATLDLDFVTGLVLTGQVLRSAQPLAGLSVQVRGLDVSDWSGSRTDHQGRFRVEGLEAGRHRIEIADHRSGLQHREELELDGDLDVLIEITTGRISGLVLDAADLSPVGGAVVSLEPLEGEPGRTFVMPRGGGSDAEGRFQISEVSTGEYRLKILKDGYAPAERVLSVAPDADLSDLEVLVEATRGLRLAVRGPSGAPVAEVYYAVLDALDRPLTLGSRPADESGLVRLPSVPAGSFELLVTAPGAAVRRLRVEVPGPTVAVSLERSATLEVVVGELVDEEGMARMMITAPDGRPFMAMRWATLVRSEWRLLYGRASVEGLPAGTYQVRVMAPDGRGWQGSATVTAGGETRLDL